MGKRFLLSVATVSMLASFANAGDLNLTITNAQNDVNYTKEWEMQNSLSATASKITIAPAFVYTPKTIPLGSEKNPVLNVTFSNVKDINVDYGNGALMVCEINSSDGATSDYPVLKYKADNGINGFTFVSYSPNGDDVYMTNGKRYAVFYNPNGDLNCSSADGAVMLTTTSDANTTLTLDGNSVSSVEMEVALGTGDSQEIHDTATGTVGKEIDQICCSVTSSYSATINSGSDFMAFSAAQGTPCGNSTTDKTDSMTITCKQYANDYGITSFNDILTLKADTALPLDKDNIVASTSGAATNEISYDGNNVIVNFKDDTASTSSNSVTYNLQLAVTGNDKISYTNFNVDFGLDLNKNGKVDMYKLQDASAGTWAYNGTTDSFSYVVASGDTQTAIRLNNNDTVDAQVYWTCTDDNGNTVSLFQVPSADQKSVSIKAGGAAAWLAKDILAKAQELNPDFAPNGKMSCKALVTTSTTTSSQGVAIMTINGSRDRVIFSGN